MFKPEIKVLDCSIRDGGLINRWRFEDQLVRATYRHLSESGTDYMEIGYKASKSQFDPTQFGKWRFCADDDVRRVIELLQDLVLGYLPSPVRLSPHTGEPQPEGPRSA